MAEMFNHLLNQLFNHSFKDIYVVSILANRDKAAMMYKSLWELISISPWWMPKSVISGLYGKYRFSSVRHCQPANVTVMFYILHQHTNDPFPRCPYCHLVVSVLLHLILDESNSDVYAITKAPCSGFNLCCFMCFVCPLISSWVIVCISLLRL